MQFPRVHRLVEQGLHSRAFPAAVVEIGSLQDVYSRRAFGRLTFAPDAPACEDTTVFDLASLTKVIATTSLVMRSCSTGHATIDTPVSRILPELDDSKRHAIALRHLLDHSSGLPAHRRLWETASGQADYQAAILATPLDHEPGVTSVYSDLGFILLGFALQRLAGAGLDEQFSTLGLDSTGVQFLPGTELKARTAPTEFDAWRGRLLVGEVHDENAAALGGVAGHAGLFGTAPGVGAFARLILRTFVEPTVLGEPALMRQFASRTGVPASSRALGWDTMLPTSSCGRLFTTSAIGHTGFTGTSLWIDPALDFYVALLTNRVHPTRDNNALSSLRPLIHDAAIEDAHAAGLLS